MKKVKGIYSKLKKWLKKIWLKDNLLCLYEIVINRMSCLSVGGHAISKSF